MAFPYALLYLRIYLLGMPVILLYNFEAAIFRSLGDTKVPLQVLMISGILNILLNLFFVIILKMTVNGVAIATVLSNLTSSFILFHKLVNSDKIIQINIRDLRIDKTCFWQIMKIGLPANHSNVWNVFYSNYLDKNSLSYSQNLPDNFNGIPDKFDNNSNLYFYCFALISLITEICSLLKPLKSTIIC